MSDYRDNWREHREQRKEFRRGLVACWKCGTKEHPVMMLCRCGEPNANYSKAEAKKVGLP